MMMTKLHTKPIVIGLVAILLIPILAAQDLAAEVVPEWVKNTAKWWIEGMVTDDEYLSSIKFLIENDIIILDTNKEAEKILGEISSEPKIAQIIIPNGNTEQSNQGFYIPMNLVVDVGTTVSWLNEDNFAHTVQSQDEEGNPDGIFSSSIINPGESFEQKFTESGEFHYYCTLHPWRIGIITVN